MQVILASASPRRRALLEQIGVGFSVRPADIDERPHPSEPPTEYVERIARSKVTAVPWDPDTVVLAADTVVVHRGRILGKPGHPDEARRMLAALSGQAHTVMTGVAVAGGAAELSVASDRALVRFAPLTDAEIVAYVEGGEPMDKAGAYGLQGIAGMFVERVEGSPSTVVGLPLHLVARLLRNHGVPILTP